MTVKELRELLTNYPDNARVFEERGGECREVNYTDIHYSTQVCDADSGVALNGGDRQPSDPDLAWLMSCPGFLILGAWS